MGLVSWHLDLQCRRGAWAWFHGIWTCSVEYWNVPLVLLERS
jgi:hypothetical protein